MSKRSKKVAASIIAATMSVTLVGVPIHACSYHLIGDVNCDGLIDAVDASWILSFYADESVGNHSEVSNQYKDVADVNRDGLIDAVDASQILSYYAALSTNGNPTWSIESVEGVDTLKLKEHYKWVVMEDNDYASEITDILTENSNISIKEKLSDGWYYIEYDGKSIGFINVTDNELEEFFYNGSSAVTTTTAIETTMASNTTIAVETTMVSNTTTTAETTTTSSTTTADTISESVTTTNSATTSMTSTTTTTVETTEAESTNEETTSEPQTTTTTITEPVITDAKPGRYIVEYGDSVSYLAENWGTTVDFICKVNGIENPNLITVGQEIIVPTYFKTFCPDFEGGSWCVWSENNFESVVIDYLNDGEVFAVIKEEWDFWKIMTESGVIGYASLEERNVVQASEYEIERFISQNG